jgi:uncharacterized membrane protein
MTTIPWLTPLQQDVGIFLLIVASAILVLLGLAGGVAWYFAYKSGNGPLALVLLLPILLPTVVLLPFIFVLGAAFQHSDESHEAANLASRRELASEAPRAIAQQPRPALATTSAKTSAKAKPEQPQPTGFEDWTPVPTA